MFITFRFLLCLKSKKIYKFLATFRITVNLPCIVSEPNDISNQTDNVIGPIFGKQDQEVTNRNQNYAH